jgi:hypothetical protein
MRPHRTGEPAVDVRLDGRVMLWGSYWGLLVMEARAVPTPKRGGRTLPSHTIMAYFLIAVKLEMSTLVGASGWLLLVPLLLQVHLTTSRGC